MSTELYCGFLSKNLLTQPAPTTLRSPLRPARGRHLVDSGCVFVGHGLTTDFRIINLFVPPSQVKDTVELYRLPGQRKISLRFLSAFLLRKGIQGDTHDSVEDARIALLLYRKYLELEKQGKNALSKTIHAIYECGRMTKWKSAHGITVS